MNRPYNYKRIRTHAEIFARDKNGASLGSMIVPLTRLEISIRVMKLVFHDAKLLEYRDEKNEQIKIEL